MLLLAEINKNVHFTDILEKLPVKNICFKGPRRIEPIPKPCWLPQTRCFSAPAGPNSVGDLKVHFLNQGPKHW